MTKAEIRKLVEEKEQRYQEMMRATCKFVLFTNLDHVDVNGVLTKSNALILEQRPVTLPTADGSWEMHHQVRGLGPNLAWETFQVDVPSMDFALERPQMAAADIRHRVPAATMTIDKGFNKVAHAFHIWFRDPNQPLYIEKFEAPYNEGWRVTDWLKDNLVWRVASCWGAPNIPTLSWWSVETLRRKKPQVPDFPYEKIEYFNS